MSEINYKEIISRVADEKQVFVWTDDLHKFVSECMKKAIDVDRRIQERKKKERVFLDNGEWFYKGSIDELLYDGGGTYYKTKKGAIVHCASMCFVGSNPWTKVDEIPAKLKSRLNPVPEKEI